TTVRSAGSAVRMSRRHIGTRPAAAIAVARTHQGARIASRPVALSRDATVSVPAAHQTASPTRTGPIQARARGTDLAGIRGQADLRVRAQVRTFNRASRVSAACSVSSFLQKQNRTWVRPDAGSR